MRRNAIMENEGESPLDDPEANTRELQLALAQMRDAWVQVAWVQDVREHTGPQRGGIRVSAEQESWLKQFLRRSGQRRPRERDFRIQGPTMRVLNWHRITMRSDSDVRSRNNLCNKNHHPVLE